MVAIKKFIRVNERIRVPHVRLIGPDANQLGIVAIQKALELANQYELDLVEVAPSANPPVCRIAYAASASNSRQRIWRGSQAVRQLSAKQLYSGSIPLRASKFCYSLTRAKFDPEEDVV